MKKIILIIIIFIFIAALAYLVYLNEKVLPQKIKAALISGLEHSTGKNVAIDSARLNIFKGLVIKGLKISEDNIDILSSKEVTSRFLIMPVFKKEVVITAMKLDSPQILLERMKDSSINIVELFFKKPIVLMDGKFRLTMSRIIVSHGRITFRDDTFEEPLTKDIRNANIDIRLLLPDKVIFNADLQIPSQVAMSVRSFGEYKILTKEFAARIELKDFYPKDFIKYCGGNISILPDGRLDASAVLDYKDNALNADAYISGMGMKFSAGKIEANLNSAIKAKVKYNFLNKELIYTGTAAINNLALYNLDILGNIYDIRGKASFSDKKFTIDNITATVLGIPVKIRTGEFNFTQNQLTFEDIEFRYNSTDYTASGTITNFQRPGVQLELNSDHIWAKTLFSVSDKTIILSALTGRFYDYGFSAQGDINVSDPKDPKADLTGSLTFELTPDKEPYKRFEDKFKGLKLIGSVKTDFTLKGALNDIGHSVIGAEVKCDKLGINNFKLNEFVMSLNHINSVSNIKYMHASLYGGSFTGSGLIDSASKDTPYQINGDIKDVRMEELKKDTAFKDKDVSGIIQARFGIKGISSDLSGLNAWGKLSISKGKLWQLNLFRGIGTLLFRRDFSSVLFEEGTCDFFIKDRNFFTNDLMMKSSLLNLYGTIKISFDRGIAASLKAEFTDDGLDAARASDIAGAIERYSIIEVKGSMDEPKYRLRPDLSNVIGDIADNFFSR